MHAPAAVEALTLPCLHLCPHRQPRTPVLMPRKPKPTPLSRCPAPRRPPRPPRPAPQTPYSAQAAEVFTVTDPAMRTIPAFTRRREHFVGRAAMLGVTAMWAGEVRVLRPGCGWGWLLGARV